MLSDKIPISPIVEVSNQNILFLIKYYLNLLAFIYPRQTVWNAFIQKRTSPFFLLLRLQPADFKGIWK